jgi:hypothetical protein
MTEAPAAAEVQAECLCQLLWAFEPVQNGDRKNIK